MRASFKSHDFGMPWEKGYGFCQAIRVGSTLGVVDLALPQQLVEIAAIAAVGPAPSRQASRSRSRKRSR